MTDDEILAAVEAGLVAQGSGQTVIEPRVHLEPDPSFRGHFNVLRGYVAPLDAAGVKIVGDYVDNYQHGLPSEIRHPQPVRSAHRHAARHPRRHRHHRHAHRRGDRARREASGAEGLDACSAISARAAPPTGTCGCSTICSTSTRSACIRAGRKAATRSPRRLSADLGKPVMATEDWRVLRRGRRHRRRGLAPARAGAAAEDRMDQARRAGRALRHDERGRAVADRHHGQDRRRRLGPVQGAASSARCAPMSRPAG